jgi:DNA-binding transcriptional LysR family regulator
MQPLLDDVALFIRIVELGTLSAAARERNVPVSQVTRALARLEAACGARLIHRSSHGLSLTDEGDTVRAYGRRLLDTATELSGELEGKAGGPSGWVRVSVSLVVAQTIVAPSLPSLYERFPRLHVEVCAEDRLADMARDGIDIALRTGHIGSDTLVALPIGEYGRTVVASPAYLRRHGTPRTVAELDQHHLITYTTNPQMNRWPLSSGVPGAVYTARGHTRSDNGALILVLTRSGAGIGRVMDRQAAPHIDSGELVPLLQDEIDSERVPIHALMLQERHRLPKVRACIDHWRQWLTDTTAAGGGGSR